MFQRMEQDGRGQVVGQIADQAQLVFGRQLGEIHFQHVLVDHGQRAHALRRMRERHDQVAVEFDGGQFSMPAQQGQGDGALAGADFHQAVTGLWTHGEHDHVDHVAVGQEVLAE